MMQAVVFVGYTLFAAWLMYKGKHYHDQAWAESEWPVAE